MRTKPCLIPNPNHEIRKVKTKTRQMHDKNSIGFYCKNKIKLK
jgi:hypothetical protein